MHTLTAASDYEHAYQHAVMLDEQACGRIQMHGADRAALLQRLSTNDLLRLRPGQGTQTVLTTPIGRIIDLLTVVALEDSLLVLTSPGQGGVVWAHLKKNIFFNDQVTLAALGRSHQQLAVFGPQAQAVLEQASGTSIADLARFASITIVINTVPVRVIQRPSPGGPGYTLLIPADANSTIMQQLAQADLLPLSPESHHMLQIEAGQPISGRELSQEYIPLETGLFEAVSFTKGCYVGQEIIARMESRGRIAKHLRGLRLQQLVAAPAALTSSDSKDAGILTSSTDSPRYGPIGLGYVRSAYAEPGTQLILAGQTGTVEVVELPFAKER